MSGAQVSLHEREESDADAQSVLERSKHKNKPIMQK